MRKHLVPDYACWQGTRCPHTEPLLNPAPDKHCFMQQSLMKLSVPVKRMYTLLACIFLLFSCKKSMDNATSIEAPETVASSDTVTSSTINFKGVNWADPRDNFVDDWLVLSGLSTTDNSDLTLSKTETILSAFQAQGANTVRLPVNPATVLQSWWPRYAAVISKASAKGMKVILAYWEGASSKDGKVDDSTAYWLMWSTVVGKYVNNGNVYFEAFNEPHGYSLANLKYLYATWLARYPQVARRRVVLDGAGYATDVNGIGADSRFDGCLLSFHFYTWFNSNYKTTADWELPVRSLGYPRRTITTEFGVPMAGNKDYAGVPAADGDVAYLQGMTNGLHNLGVGCVYWPGLRTGDTYSMFTYTGNAVKVNSATGLARLQYAWSR